MSSLMEELEKALQRVCKWRSVFAGWQLGTRSDTDAECAAIRDHREVTILLRVEVSALAKLMIDAGVFTQEMWYRQLIEEAEALNEMYRKKFPGMEATDVGIHYDTKIASETMKRMNFKP
jgi:hypothetical protein